MAAEVSKSYAPSSTLTNQIKRASQDGSLQPRRVTVIQDDSKVALVSPDPFLKGSPSAQSAPITIPQPKRKMTVVQPHSKTPQYPCPNKVEPKVLPFTWIEDEELD